MNSTGDFCRLPPSTTSFTQSLITSMPVSDLPQGLHTVTTWRQTASGVKVPESELTFKFAMTPEVSEKASANR